MFVNFSEETQHILKQAEKQRDELNHPYVGSEHLFLSILKDNRLNEIFNKHKLTYERFKNKLVSLVGIGSKKSTFNLYTPLLRKVLENVVIEAREDNNLSVTPEMLIIAILDEENGVAYSILKSLKINIDKLYFDIKNRKNNKCVKRKRLLVEELGTNLTKLARDKKLDPVIGRDNEIEKTLEILLRRKKNNPILIGPAGVGKTAIVEGIANIIANKRCPSNLLDKQIISLNIFSMVSGTKYRGEFEEKMKTLIKELEDNSDVILFIDEIHTIVGAGGAEGAIDASNIFKPALARGKIKIIGATTLDEYKKYIEPDTALARRFQCINVLEPDKENTVKILKEIKPLYEKFHNIIIPDNLIDDMVNLSERYITNRFEPDRSIDVLDEVSAKVSMRLSPYEKKNKFYEKRLSYIRKEKIRALSKKRFKYAYELKVDENRLLKKLGNIKNDKKKVCKNDIYEVIKEKSNVPVIQFDNKRKLFYDEIKTKLNNIVIGQESGINNIIKALKIKEITKNKKCYSAVIYGEKATGKTLLCNSFANLIVNKNNIIKIDLSEYKEYHAISKLIGTTAGYLGYDNKNHVFEKVRSNPHSALIIDNFELASIEVKNLFFRILENGYIEDAADNKIDFSNCVLLFTITTKENNDLLGFNNISKKTNNSISKTLLSMVDTSIYFSKVCDNDIKKIINNKINKILNKYDISVEINDLYIEKILGIIKNEDNLATLNNIIEKEFESKIIDAILNNKKHISFVQKEKVIL